MTDNQKNHYSALFSDIFLDLQEDITLNQKKKISDPEWLWDLMDMVLLPMKLRSGRGGRWEGAPATRGSRHSVPCGTRLGSQSPEQNICTAFPIELWTSDTAVRTETNSNTSNTFHISLSQDSCTLFNI